MDQLDGLSTEVGNIYAFFFWIVQVFVLQPKRKNLQSESWLDFVRSTFFWNAMGFRNLALIEIKRLENYYNGEEDWRTKFLKCLFPLWDLRPGFGRTEDLPTFVLHYFAFRLERPAFCCKLTQQSVDVQPVTIGQLRASNSTFRFVIGSTSWSRKKIWQHSGTSRFIQTGEINEQDQRSGWKRLDLNQVDSTFGNNNIHQIFINEFTPSITG